MRKELLKYLPPVLLQTIEFPLLCLSEQPEISLLLDTVDEVLKNQFVETATERAIQRYEAIFKIIPKDTQTLEERRIEILSKMNLRLPYTIRMLRMQLSKLCGADGFTVDVIPDKYQIIVNLPDRNKNYLPTIADLLRRMVPANMGITAKANSSPVTISIYVGGAQAGMTSRVSLPVLEPEQNFSAILALHSVSGGIRSRAELETLEPEQDFSTEVSLTHTQSGNCSRISLNRLER